MCKIIEFPVNRIRKTESNGYKNLKALFEVSASVETCSFYLDTVEELFRKSQITENEMLTLRRIGLPGFESPAGFTRKIQRKVKRWKNEK